MKQPSFWYRKSSFLKWILSPLGKIYALSVQRRLNKTEPFQPSVPVICVGNLCVGGSGKTPVALAIADFLIGQGKRVVFLSHGYKSIHQDIVVDLEKPEGIGDEALLMARKAPTVVNKNRAEGVRRAQKMGAEVIIMDDGFQNPSVVKTFSVLVFDGTYGIGNGACLPAGPMREKLKVGLKRADAVIIMGQDKTGLKEQIEKENLGLPILTGNLKPLRDLSMLSGFAFAGIGHPEKFFNMLLAYGVNLKGVKSFSDHTQYTPKMLDDLLKKKMPLLTTAKDMVKIPSAYQDKITCVDVVFKPDSEENWVHLLEEL